MVLAVKTLHHYWSHLASTSNSEREMHYTFGVRNTFSVLKLTSQKKRLSLKQTSLWECCVPNFRLSSFHMISNLSLKHLLKVPIKSLTAPDWVLEKHQVVTHCSGDTLQRLVYITVVMMHHVKGGEEKQLRALMNIRHLAPHSKCSW